MNFLKRYKWLLIFSCFFAFLTPGVFEYADKERGYDATGGEIFFPFIPLVVWMVIKSMNEVFDND